MSQTPTKYSGFLMKITTSLHPTWVIKYILFDLKKKNTYNILVWMFQPQHGGV